MNHLKKYVLPFFTLCLAVIASAPTVLAQPPAATPEIPIDFGASSTTYIQILAGAVVIVWALKMGGSVLVKMTQWLASSASAKRV